jgi:molybdopterin molybdotransferase
LPVTITDLGILADDAAIIEETISLAAEAHDLILTTGGASRGEEDHVITTIDHLGKRHLWQIAVKPGRPMTFGQIGDCVFMGLPGNPVAAFVCFLLYVRPAITILSGGKWQEPSRFLIRAAFSIPRKKKNRREFLRGWLQADETGQLAVHKFPRDGSGLITGLRQATGLIELEEELESIEEGEPVAFIPFSEFGIG